MCIGMYMRLQQRQSKHEGRAEQASKECILNSACSHKWNSMIWRGHPTLPLASHSHLSHAQYPMIECPSPNHCVPMCVCVWCSHSMCVCGVLTHELTVSQVVVGRFGHIAFGMSSDCWVLACSMLPLIRYRIFTYDVCVYVRVRVCVCAYVCMYVCI